MTTPDPKTGPARRTYASLREERGWREEWTIDGVERCSICPMDSRTYWRHVERTGRWDAKDSLYEEVGT